MQAYPTRLNEKGTEPVANGFEACICDRLDPVDTATWDRLFPNLPDSLPMIRLVQESGMDGFAFKSLLIRHNGSPFLLLPLFHLRLDVETLVDGSLRRVVRMASRLAPGLLRPGVLGVGFVEGECGAVGFDPACSPALLREAWDIAMQSLWRLAKDLRAKVALFLNFTTETARWLPPEDFNGFTRIDTYPSGSLQLPFDTEDAYLASLAKSTRKDLRRKMRDANDIQIQHTTDPGPHIERIYALYRQTVDRSEMAFGQHRQSYFERVCEAVPGASYTLYFSGDQLLAFNLLVEHGNRLVDKYFGMEQKAGRERNLYFVSWMENVRQCIEKRIPLYHAGPGSEATKARLGAELIPSLTFFRHRNPVLHAALGRMRSLLAYTPEVSVPPAVLGAGFS